jgi:hypothetical protein
MISASSFLWSFRNDFEHVDASYLRFIVKLAVAGSHAVVSRLLVPRDRDAVADPAAYSHSIRRPFWLATMVANSLTIVSNLLDSTTTQPFVEAIPLLLGITNSFVAFSFDHDRVQRGGSWLALALVVFGSAFYFTQGMA